MPSTGEDRTTRTIRVKPGAGRTRVGGTYGHGELIVAVAVPPVDGRATQAAIAAVAEALGLKAHDLRLLSGATSRTKVLSVPTSAIPRWDALLVD